MTCTLTLGGINPSEVEENRFPLYKGIVGIGGLLIFFLSQRCFMIVGDLRKRAKERHMRHPPAGHVHHHDKSDEEEATANLRISSDDDKHANANAQQKDSGSDFALITLRSVGELREERGGLRLESRIDQGVPIEKDELGKKFGVTKLSSSNEDGKNHKHDQDTTDAADAQRTPPSSSKQKNKHEEHSHDEKHEHDHEEDGHGHDHSVPTSVKSLMAMVILGQFTSLLLLLHRSLFLFLSSLSFPFNLLQLSS